MLKRNFFVLKKRDLAGIFDALTAHNILKSFCSSRKSSHGLEVITVAFLGMSYKIDSPKAVPEPRVHMRVCAFESRD
jgi:hypothetical protein